MSETDPKDLGSKSPNPKAFERLTHGHSADQIRARLANQPQASYLRDWVYGGVDGAVTTFAIVSGVVGANLDSRTILILGAANIVADGFSMAASNYLGTKTERDELRLIEAYERRQIEVAPEGEIEEIRQILKQKGFIGDALEKAVKLITSNPDRWVETMLVEEYGISMNLRSPWKSGMHTFLSFILFGLVPLLPFIFTVSHAFAVSVTATAATFVLIGALKSRWSLIPWWKSSLTTLLIGGGASAFAYGIGYLFR